MVRRAVAFILVTAIQTAGLRVHGGGDKKPTTLQDELVEDAREHRVETEPAKLFARHNAMKGANMTHIHAVVDYPDCDKDSRITGFRCPACSSHRLQNLITVIERDGQRCILSGKRDKKSPVITLVENNPKPICKTTDGEVYSWATEDKRYPYGCDGEYNLALFNRISTSPLHATQIALPKLGDEQITLYSFPAGSLGDRLVHEVWPPKGACTTQNKCGLYAHLHALYEVSGNPAAIYCSGLPKYATFDKKCYNKLRTVILIPQLKSFLSENWNIDPDYPNPLSAPVTVYDDFFFPLLEKFLADHNNKIDAGRVYVGGVSGGASGALYAALRRPDIFSLAVTSDVCSDNFLKQAKPFLENLPPPDQRRLKAVVMGRGDRSDSSSICDKDEFTMDALADLSKKVKVHMRYISAIGHGMWGHVFNEWPELHQVLIEGAQPNIWW